MDGGKIDTMTPSLYTVTARSAETKDTFTLKLAPKDGTGGYAFTPGQFNMLYVFGMGEVPISISGPAGGGSPLIHTIRAVGAVTNAMQAMRKGDQIGVRGPFGAGWPMDKLVGKDVLIMAGGIGLAPLRPAVYHLIRRREKFGKVALLYGARTPGDLLYLKELEKWRASLDMETLVTVDRGMDGWKGNVGVVTTLLAKSTFDPARAAALICGPEVMMRFSAMELFKRGVAPENVFVSMERNMKCGAGLCGACQFGPVFICKDGPVFPYPAIKELWGKREI